MGTAGPIPELRPLSLGELLDRTFTLYRNNFWLFVGIMAIPSAFSVPFSALFFSAQGAAIAVGRPSTGFAIGAASVALAFFFLFWIVYALGIGATTYAVSQAYLGQKTTVRAAYGRVRGKFMKILGVVIVALLRAFGMLLVAAIGIGVVVAAAIGVTTLLGRGQPRPVLVVVTVIFLALIYVTGIGLWFLWSLRYAVSIPALLLENLKVLESLRRSVKLTYGRRWQMLVAVALCGIIAYAGVIVFQGPFFLTMMFANRSGRIPEWLAFTFATSGAIGGAITGPVLLIILVLYYYDNRIRKEAFDLQFMMSSLDGPVPAPGTTLPG
jgi:hypothetical protein